ncbi:unnamed protein product [Rotaria socialis]
MKLVICVIVERDLEALLLTEQNLGRGYWFPFDEIQPGETRTLAAKRIANKIGPHDFDPICVLKIRCSDLLPCLPSTHTYYLLTKSSLIRANVPNTVKSVWMNLERINMAIKNRELLGLEPYNVLKTILERQQTNGWDKLSSGGKIFEEPTFQVVDFQQTGLTNLASSSPLEQLISSAKFTNKVQESIFKEFYSYTFPSEHMSLKAFTEAMDNKLSTTEKSKIQAYFRAFDSQKNSYLTYTDYLIGLAAMDPNTSHGGTPAELRCRYIFRFYNAKNTGLMSIEEFRALHTDVQSRKIGKANDDPTLNNEILSTFNSFNLQPSNQLALVDFLNSVGQLKYRGTSVLFRLTAVTQDLLRMSRRYRDNQNDRSEDNINYEIADHCVTLKKSGTLYQVESLRAMNYNTQFSKTTEEKLRSLPRSLSEEIFDRRTTATDIQEMLRLFEKHDHTKDALVWSPYSTNQLGRTVITLCKEVREMIRCEPRCLKLSSPCYILGDLHGNYEDLICFEKCLWRATPLLAPASFLFLGDYVDRGIHGLEVVIYLLASKFQCPKKVLLLRGNHEIRKVQQMFSFLKECLTKFGDTLGKEVWDAINSVFDVLPLAAVIDDKILCFHGGIPSPASCPGDFISMVNDIPVPLSDPEIESPLAWEIMWNDPFSIDKNMMLQIPNGAKAGFFNNTRRSTGNYFTNEALTVFLAKNNFTHVVRAHEVQQAGFKVQLGGHLLTVFSSSHYCGGTNDAAAVLVDSSKLRLIRLHTK